MTRSLQSLILFACAFIAAAQAPERRFEPIRTTRQPVLILFDEHERHIDLVRTTREQVKRVGGRVRTVIGLAGIVADLDPGSAAEIEASAGVSIHSGPIAAPEFVDPATSAAIDAWNRLRVPERPREIGAPPLRRLANDARERKERPHSRFERQMVTAEYRRHARERLRTLPSRLQRSDGVSCGSNGADYFDTSLYLAGEIAVGVHYGPGDQPWTPALAAATFASVVHALDQFVDKQPDARIAFTYVNEVDGAGNPLPLPPNEQTYVNDLRSTYCTDWAFMIILSNGGVWPNADLYGPTIRMERTFLHFEDVLRHETGHIFGAGDAYPPHHSPDTRHGYLNAAHANAGGVGSGYFTGAGEYQEDLMAGWGPTLGYNSVIGVWTAGQLGWFAHGSRGVLDVLDTKPVIDAATVTHVVNPATSAATFHGIAVDRPLLNESYYGSVSINRITAVQYRIATGPWLDAAAADGVFDSASEDFLFTTPPLPNGTYSVQIRAVNTIDATTPIAYSQSLVVSGSSVTNTRPFASLAVTPERAVAGTTIQVSGFGSRDVEPGPLMFSWNFGNAWTPFSPVGLATTAFATPGTYPIALRVRDAQGLIHLVTKTVTATAADTPPIARLSVTPENQHGTSQNYTVFLSATASRDAETPLSQLKVRWDVDCNGWDGPASLQKGKLVSLVNSVHPKSDRRCMRIQVIDGANNTSEVERYVWTVPYNHRPTISNVLFTPNGSDFVMTVSATDPDLLTSWDGILEYRYDFEGDGIWDTTYQPFPSIVVPAAHRYTVWVEVRDRFHARATWIWNPCGPLAC
ncbi:MAG TPA: PKD domain-containing protein [Thermoanaerobaculia bacterium]|nr:PKD domain-containing protein [Thermoanaerobaculia bacterium]